MLNPFKSTSFKSKTVDEIVSGFTTVADALEAKAQELSDRSDQCVVRLSELEEEAFECSSESARAISVATKIRKIAGENA